MAAKVEAETKITPLYHHSGYAQVSARAEALHQRLEVVKAEARKPRPDPLAELITRLTGDPQAALTVAEPTVDQSRQIQALEQAVAAVQAEGLRLRAELSRELADRLRPEHTTRARGLVEALEQAIELMTDDASAYRRVSDLGYDPPALLLSVADREALTRMLDRVRARQGG